MTTAGPTTAAGVARPLETLVNRIFCAYAFLGFLPGLADIAAQVPGIAPWWLAVFGVGVVLTLAWMVVLAVRSRSLRWPYLVYAGLVLVGVLMSHWAFTPFTVGSPLMWCGTGTAVVAAGLALGLRAGTVYALLLATSYGLQRPQPEFGSATWATALSEAMFMVMGALAVLALGLGMIEAGRAADELAEEVYRRELTEAVDRSLAAERHRLDGVIHDEVMTALVAVAHAAGPDADRRQVAGAAALAGSTLSTLDALQREVPAAGWLSADVLYRLVRETARRVSPDVLVTDDVDPALRAQPVPIAAAEAFLDAMREAVRNAVRHADADQVGVRVALRGEAGREAVLSVTVVDDGRGFDPQDVPIERLGLALSIRGRLAGVGAGCTVDSRVGTGTAVTMSYPLACQRAVRTRPGTDDALPAAFPVRQLTLILWLVTFGHLVLGVVNLGQTSPDWPTLIAMPLLPVLTALLVYPGRSLRLSRSVTATAVGLIPVISVLVFAVQPQDGEWPGFALWHGYPSQLALVTMVVRRRAGAALLGLAGFLLPGVWWFGGSGMTAIGLLILGFGPVSFVVLAALATRVLRSIGRQQQELAAQESAAIEESVRRDVALVQRSLWLDDLRVTVRPTLARASALTADVPTELAAECLLLEATLREGLLARNVMTEELAQLTQAARRRGVTVTFVDSRETPVPDLVGRAVIAEVRNVLTSSTVSRLVVRLGPDGRRELASVVAQDAGDTSMTVIDAGGARTEVT